MSIYIDDFEKMYNASISIKGLRDKVLQLAIEGKLVLQDLTDEPARILIEKIKSEKDKLVKEKKIKKQNKFEPISEDEIQFDLPENWEWVRLGDYVSNSGQKKPDQTFTYIDVSSINNNLGVIGEEYSVLKPDNAPSRARKLVDLGSVIYSTVRPYLLNVAVIDREFEHEPIVSTAFAVMNLHANCSNQYLYYYLRSPAFVRYVESQMVGLAYPAINDKNLMNGLVPLPPVKEQTRIVKKVKSLMGLIDVMEEMFKKKEHLMELLPQAVVDAIGSCQTEEGLKSQLEFVIENFEEIFQTPESMQDLRNVILQLAIEGKLVEQDSNDEPASELVKKIQVERDKLVAEKKIKKPKKLEPITEDEIPFEIPESWEWIKLGNITNMRRGASPRPIKAYQTDGEGVNWIKIGDATRCGGKYVTSVKEKITHDGALKSVYLEPGALIMSNSMSFGKAYILGVDGCIHDGWLSFTFNEKYILPELLQLFLSASFKQFDEMAVGTGVRNLNTDRVRETLIPLVPVNHQQKIIDKVNSLMTIIDEMEEKLKKKQQIVELLGTV